MNPRPSGYQPDISSRTVCLLSRNWQLTGAPRARDGRPTLPKPLGHDELWLKVVAILTPIIGLDNVALAAVTLWSFVHGLMTLERANLLGGKKPGDVSDFGTVALLKGFALGKKA